MQRLPPVLLTVGAVLWTLVIVSAPRALRSDTLAPFAAQVYAGARRICHQRPERTFHLAGMQMPVCARCSALYVAGALGAVAGWAAVRRPRGTRTLLLVSAAPTALTWSVEILGLAAFTNLTRAVAALPLGLAAGWVFVQMLRYDAQLDARQDHDS